MQQNNNRQFEHLKRLYETKFYQSSQEASTIQKVLNFQKKLQKAKIKNTISHRQCKNIMDTSPLGEQNEHHRPKTNYTSHRTKINQHYSIQNKPIENPISQSFKFFLKNSTKNQYSFLAQNIRNRRNLTNQSNKNQINSFAQRGFTHEDNRSKNKSEIYISKIEMRDFFLSFNLSKNQAKKKNLSLIPNKNIKERQTSFFQSKRLKKQQIKRFSFVYNKQGQNDGRKDSPSSQERNSLSRQKLDPKNLGQILKIQKNNRDNYRQSLSKDYRGKRKLKIQSNRRQQDNTDKKQSTYEDKIFNLQLNPWNTIDGDYI